MCGVTMQQYIPEDCASQERRTEVNSGTQDGTACSQPSFLATQRHMVLDGVTLLNLEVLQNATDGAVSGSLYQRLDHCSTPFGVCHCLFSCFIILLPQNEVMTVTKYSAQVYASGCLSNGKMDRSREEECVVELLRLQPWV